MTFSLVSVFYFAFSTFHVRLNELVCTLYPCYIKHNCSLLRIFNCDTPASVWVFLCHLLITWVMLGYLGSCSLVKRSVLGRYYLPQNLGTDFLVYCFHWSLSASISVWRKARWIPILVKHYVVWHISYLSWVLLWILET